MSKRYVIVGSSAAGIAAVGKVKELDPKGEIVCISRSSLAPYNTCLLADLLAGVKSQPDIVTRQPSFFEKNDISLMLSTSVTQIDAAKKRIVLDDGQRFSYDALFLGLGTSARWLTLPGAETVAGVYAFYTLEDVLKVMAYIEHNGVKHVTVIGAGLSGLECADALHARGLQVSVIERSGQVLAHHVDEAGAAMIVANAKGKGVDVYLNEMVTEVLSMNGRVTGVRLANGQTLPTQMVIIAAGGTPNSNIARQVGIELDGSHIKTDKYLGTSAPGVFVGGDVCKVKSIISGQLVPSVKWSDAGMQGMVAAYGMVGDPKVYPGVISSIGSQFFGLFFASCGNVRSQTGTAMLIRNEDDLYHKITFDEHNVISGYLIVGKTRGDVGLHRRMMTERIGLEKVRELLVD